MKVFLSWSGNISKEIAEELNKWIPTVLQSVKPYFSPSDIEKGAKWDSEITNNLNESSMGIICVTAENTNKPWILFEAGALSNKLEKSRVCPLLFEIANSDLTGPLATFQTTIFNKNEFKKLIQTINKQLGETKVMDAIFEETFETFFPKLEQKINAIIKKNQSKDIERPIERTDREILEEILELTRRQYITKPKRTFTFPTLEQEVNFEKQYDEISEKEKEFIESMIYKYIKENKFRLKEYQQLDENLLLEYFRSNMDIRQATGNPENLMRLIKEFKNQ